MPTPGAGTGGARSPARSRGPGRRGTAARDELVGELLAGGHEPAGPPAADPDPSLDLPRNRRRSGGTAIPSGRPGAERHIRRLVVERVEHGGPDDPGLDAEPADGEGPQPAVPERGNLEESRILTRGGSRERQRTRGSDSPLLEPIQERRERPAVVIEAQPAGEQDDLHGVIHGPPRPRRDAGTPCLQSSFAEPVSASQAGVGIDASMVYTVSFLDPGPGKLHPSLSVPHEFTPDLGNRFLDPRRPAQSLESAPGERRPGRPRQARGDQARRRRPPGRGARADRGRAGRGQDAAGPGPGRQHRLFVPADPVHARPAPLGHPRLERLPRRHAASSSSSRGRSSPT